MNIDAELAAMGRMKVSELKEKYEAVFGESTKTGNKQWLIKRIAWRIQSLSEGTISERARQRATELARDSDVRLNAPKVKPVVVGAVKSTVIARSDQRLPPPGTLIVREYRGQRLQIKVLGSGFEFEGSVFKTLSAVAKHITGQHCNGYYFFRLTGGAK
jgi:hypothetical protein